MAQLNTKLKAFTLVETIVAFVLILILTGIASVIFVNVNSSSRFWTKMRTEQELEKIMSETKSDGSYLDETYEMNDISIVKEVTRIENTQNLIFIELKALDPKGREYASIKETIIKD